jgi:hypothetical protein
MNGQEAFEAKKIRLFYTPCFSPWNISHPTRSASISFPPFASCDIDLYSFLSNILYVSLPPHKEEKKVCVCVFWKLWLRKFPLKVLKYMSYNSRPLYTRSQGLQKKTFLLIYHIVALTWDQAKRKDIYQLGRPICNPWGQCCSNKIFLFWWNSRCRIKVNLNQTLYLLFLHIIFLHFSFLLLSLWLMEEVFFFPTWNLIMKYTRVTSISCILSLPIHGGLTFRIEEKHWWENEWSPEKKNESTLWKVEALVPI